MPPTLLFLGDLDEPHGVDLLLRAMPMLLRSHPRTRLVLIGDGPLAEPLAAYSRYLQLEEAISFLPARPMPHHAEAIHAADLVVIPGREAVSSYALRAAWWAHKPVVATHEAVQALAEHDRDALLVYPSENSIVAAVGRLLDDVVLARKLGEAGHRRWLGGFLPESSRSPLSPLDEARPNHDPEHYPP